MKAACDALVSVDPDCFGHPGRIGNLGVRVDQRGARFDVLLSDAGHLFDEYDAAIRAALGESAAVVKDMATGYYTSRESSALPVMPSPIINYGPVGSQQIGDRNTAYVRQIVDIDRRSFDQAIEVIRAHIAEFSESNRDEVEHHLDTVQEELQRPEPRPSRLKTALGAIRRFLPDLLGAAGKAAMETAIDSAIKAHGS
jgi:hypothetical protein